MRATGGIELRTETTDHAPPVVVCGIRGHHGPGLNGSLTDGLGPVHPRLTGGVKGDHLECRTVLVDGDEPVTGFMTDVHLEPHDSANRAVFVVGEDAFNQRMARREKVDGLVLDRFLTVERADIARARRNPGQGVHECAIADLDREHAVRPRLRDGEPEANRRRDDHFLVELIEFRREAAQNRRGHSRAIGVAMQLLIRGFANASAARMGFGNQRVEALRRQRGVGIERNLFECTFNMGELRVESRQRLAEQPQRFK